MAEGLKRDRDAAGRPRNARRRDALGRPLGVRTARAPEDPSALPPREALRVGQQLLDGDRPFAAHEVFESVWKATSGSERALWRGLAQLAVGLTHRARGNESGARALLERAAGTLAEVDGSPYEVPVDRLRAWALAAANEPAVGPLPRLDGQAAVERD